MEQVDAILQQLMHAKPKPKPSDREREALERELGKASYTGD